MSRTTKKRGERTREIGVLVILDTTHRHQCPKLARQHNETAAAFADRVRDELLRLQGDL